MESSSNSPVVANGGAEVQSRPGLESARFQKFECEKDNSAFNLNPLVSELAPLQNDGDAKDDKKAAEVTAAVSPGAG